MFRRTFGIAILSMVLIVHGNQAGGGKNGKKFEIPKDAIAGKVKAVDERAANFTIALKNGNDRVFTVDDKTEFWGPKGGDRGNGPKGLKDDCMAKGYDIHVMPAKDGKIAKDVYFPNRKKSAEDLMIGKVVLSDGKTEKEAKRDRVESEVGGTTKYSKTRTIKREINFSTRLGLSAEVEAKIGASIQAIRADLTARIRGSIERELGEKWTAEISESVEHTINLNKNPKVEVIWIDVYRTGSVQLTVDGNTHTVPFEFPVATRTVIKAIK